MHLLMAAAVVMSAEFCTGVCVREVLCPQGLHMGLRQRLTCLQVEG